MKTALIALCLTFLSWGNIDWDCMKLCLGQGGLTWDQCEYKCSQ